jgi:hypothetical protein
MLFNEFRSRRLEKVETDMQLGEATETRYDVFGRIVKATDAEAALKVYLNNLPEYIRNAKLGHSESGYSIIIDGDTISFQSLDALDKLANPHWELETGVKGRPSSVRKIMDYIPFIKSLFE